jgi:hypothetical protein
MFWVISYVYMAVTFFYLVCEVIGTASAPGLLCQPPVIVKIIVEKQMECRLAGETEVLGENLPLPHFCSSQNPTWPDPGLNPGRRGGKPATNRLSYGAAMAFTFCFVCRFAFLFPSLTMVGDNDWTYITLPNTCVHCWQQLAIFNNDRFWILLCEV